MDSIRAALTAAFDKSEGDKIPDAPDEAVVEPVSTGVADDSAAPASAAPVDEATPSNESVDATSPVTTPVASAPAAATETPAPASWSNEERTAWATVPKAARDAINRREGEMNRALQDSASARRRAEALDKSAKPYQPLLDSYGVQVEQVIPGLLATRAALEVGSPSQKAQLVANLCADFGIEIGLLDEALSGRYQNGQPEPRYQPQNHQIDLTNNPALAPLFAMAEQIKSVQTERAAQAIGTVSSDPHYNAVRFTMADFIEQARAQGRQLGLPEALSLAKQFHGLGAAPAAAGSGNPLSDAARTLAAARNAASSVSGAPKPTPPRKPGEGTLREELEANLAARR